MISSPAARAEKGVTIAHIRAAWRQFRIIQGPLGTASRYFFGWIYAALQHEKILTAMDKLKIPPPAL